MFAELLCVLVAIGAEPLALPQFPPTKVCAANSWESWAWREHFRRIMEAGAGDSDTELLFKAVERDSWTWWDLAHVQDSHLNDDDRFAAEGRVIEAIGLSRYLGGIGPPVQPYGAKR